MSTLAAADLNALLAAANQAEKDNRHDAAEALRRVAAWIDDAGATVIGARWEADMARADARATLECNRMLDDEARFLRAELDDLLGALRDVLPAAESHPDVGPAMREAINRARSLVS